MSSTVMATSPIEELLAQHPRLLKAWHVLKILWKGVCIFIDWTLGLKIVVWVGARLILTVGRSSETLLLFATLWATGQQVQAEWINGLFGVHGKNITGTLPDQLTGLTTVIFSLVPEIILPYAILTTIKHWQTTCQQKTKGGRAYYGLWALLYTVPTVVFLGLTLITLKNMGSGNIADAAAGTMNVRSLASWSYALVEMLYPMITPLATHRSKTETAIIEANDRLALENQKKLDKLTEQQANIDKQLAKIETSLADTVHQMNASTDQVNASIEKALTTVHPTVNQPDDNRIEELSNQVLQLQDLIYAMINQANGERQGKRIAVEVNTLSSTRSQSVYQITEETENNDPQFIDSRTQTHDTGPLQAVSVPQLEVSGVHPDKVKEVLSLYLSGTAWRSIPGSWDKTRRPIKEAYEAYLLTQTQEVNA